MRNTIPIMDLNNPDEMIRANGAAEAARTNRLREEVSDYTQVIEQLRELYDRNNELVQKLQFMNRSQTDEIRRLLQENNDRITEKLSSLQDYDTQAMQDGISAAVADSQQTVLTALQKTQDHASQLQQQSDDFNHKENVRVYRNIQASMIAELGKLIAVLAIQLLEGVGLLSMFLSMH